MIEKNESQTEDLEHLLAAEFGKLIEQTRTEVIAPNARLVVPETPILLQSEVRTFRSVIRAVLRRNAKYAEPVATHPHWIVEQDGDIAPHPVYNSTQGKVVIPCTKKAPIGNETVIQGRAAEVLEEWIQKGLTKNRVVRIACGMFLERWVDQRDRFIDVLELCNRAGLSQSHADRELRPHALIKGWELYRTPNDREFTLLHQDEPTSIALRSYPFWIKQNKPLLHACSLLIERYVGNGRAVSMHELENIAGDGLGMTLVHDIQEATSQSRTFIMQGDALAGWRLEEHPQSDFEILKNFGRAPNRLPA